MGYLGISLGLKNRRCDLDDTLIQETPCSPPCQGGQRSWGSAAMSDLIVSSPLQQDLLLSSSDMSQLQQDLLLSSSGMSQLHKNTLLPSSDMSQLQQDLLLSSSGMSQLHK